MKKKQYIRPEVYKIVLDSTISIQMLSGPIDPPPHGLAPEGGGSKPFASPFGDKPFS